MSAHRPTPRRPPLSAPRGQLRAAYRSALTARLRAGTAARPADAADSDPRGLLGTWAQGP